MPCSIRQDGVVPQIVQKLGADPASAKEAVQAELDKLPKVYGQQHSLSYRRACSMSWTWPRLRLTGSRTSSSPPSTC